MNLEIRLCNTHFSCIPCNTVYIPTYVPCELIRCHFNHSSSRVLSHRFDSMMSRQLTCHVTPTQPSCPTHSLVTVTPTHLSCHVTPNHLSCKYLLTPTHSSCRSNSRVLPFCHTNSPIISHRLTHNSPRTAVVTSHRLTRFPRLSCGGLQRFLLDIEVAQILFRPHFSVDCLSQLRASELLKRKVYWYIWAHMYVHIRLSNK